jgi:protein-disulfide isomerase
MNRHNKIITLVFFWALSFTFFLNGSLAIAESNPKATTYDNNPIIAELDGQPIFLDDLKNAKIQDTLVQLYRMQKDVLKRQVLSSLLQNHPEISDIEPPKLSLKDMKQFYESTPGIKDLGSFEEMKERIQDYLGKIFEANYNDRIYQLALQKGWLVEFLKEPNDFRLVASLGTAVRYFEDSKSSNKKVAVLEYSDFQCPFCKRVQKTLKKLRVEYKDSVQFAYRHFPLPFHKQASSIAEAVECARDQDKFWELQSIIYQKQEVLEVGDILRAADEAGVKSMDDFKSCWDGGKYKARVQNDLKEGAQMGIQGTPTFIIGSYDAETDTISGEMFSGAVPEEKFISTIKKYLRSAESNVMN